jgi:hypothetical protein
MWLRVCGSARDLLQRLLVRASANVNRFADLDYKRMNPIQRFANKRILFV